MKSIQTKLFAPIVWVGFICGFWLSTASAQQPLPRVAYCTTCQTDAQWAHAAEQDSLTRWHRVSGTDQVYVLNTQNYQVRFYYVNRWYQEGAIDPRSTDPGSTGPSYKESYNNPIDEKLPASKMQSGFGYYYAEAVRGSGDPDVMTAIQDAIVLLDDFASSLSEDVSWEDLDLPDRISSAVDLIGPDDSEAGFNRSGLEDLLNNYLVDRYNTFYLIAYDLAKRFMDRFLADSLFSLGTITVQFPDGTKIVVEIVQLYENVGENSFFAKLEVLQSTASGPDLISIPESPGQFNNFEYAGNENTLGALIELARRYGIPITGPGGDGTGMQRMTCEIEGDEIRCKVTAFTGN